MSDGIDRQRIYIECLKQRIDTFKELNTKAWCVGKMTLLLLTH
jgi:hypothetical protein